MKKLIDKCIKIYRASPFIRYFFVGGISWVVDAAVLLIVNRTAGGLIPDGELRLAVATYAGGIVGFVVNYILTLLMAFTTEENRKQGKSIKAFIIIVAVSIVGWWLKEMLMQLGVNILMLGEDWLVNIPASAIVLIWNYLGRRLLVFRDSKKHDDSSGQNN